MMNYITFIFLFNEANDYSSAEDFIRAMFGCVDPATTMFRKHKEQEPQTYEMLFKESYVEMLSKIYMCANVKTDDEFTKALESISGLPYDNLLQTSGHEYTLYVSDRNIRAYMAYIAITYSLCSKEE